MKRNEQDPKALKCSQDSATGDPWISMPGGLFPIDFFFFFFNQLHRGALELLIKEVEKEANLVEVFVLKICTL